jgi:DNA-binding transcriptional LysR family regulator
MNRLGAMEAFVRVVDAGSFCGAAKQLRIGQPAVSKTIAQLEERLGVRLLLRSTHGLTPTEAGRNFYDRAKRSIEEAEAAELAARGTAAALSGRLRVCAPLTFTRLHVMPRLPVFLAEHPSLDVDVVLEDRDTDLIEAGIDVALRIGRLTDSAVTARKIGQCQRRVIGTPAYFGARGVPPRTPADLLTHQAIIYEQRDGGASWAFRKGSSETTVTLSGRLRVSASEGIREAVFAGLGFAVASEWVFAPELKSGAVISILDDWSLPAVDLWGVFPAGRQASAKARAFASFIEAEMSNAEFAGQELSCSVSHIGSSGSGDRPGRVSRSGIAGLVGARLERKREIGAEKRAPGSARSSLAA